MNIQMIIGQLFRSKTGMPYKVSIYDAKIDNYQEIIDDVCNIESATIKYFESKHDGEWMYNKAAKLKLDADLAHGLIDFDQYVVMDNEIENQKNEILAAFIDSTDDLFVVAYKNRLCQVQKTYSRDKYISLMSFDSWFDMRESKELAELAIAQITTSSNYVDSKKIAEITERYRHDKMLRRGR